MQIKYKGRESKMMALRVELIGVIGLNPVSVANSMLK